jgi:hypothetical protein
VAGGARRGRGRRAKEGCDQAAAVADVADVEPGQLGDVEPCFSKLDYHGQVVFP